MRKEMIVFALGLLLIPTVFAAQSLGTFKVNEPMMLIQTCDNSTYANITRISNPDSTFSLNTPTLMTKNGNNYNYSFANNSQIGDYLVYGNCDEDGIITEWAYDFEITPSGDDDRTNFNYIILLISFGIILLGFYLTDGWIVILGTFGLYFTGIYTILFGIAGVRSLVTTYAIALIILGVAAYISIKSAIELLG